MHWSFWIYCFVSVSGYVVGAILSRLNALPHWLVSDR